MLTGLTETDIGQVAALLALASAAYSAVAAGLGARLRRPELVRSGMRGVVATGLLILLTAGSLLWALWTHDFAVTYVFDYSNRESAQIYNLSSLWAGQAGSLMLWCLMLNLFAGVVLWQNRGGRNRALVPWVIAIMMAYQVFFLGLINFVVESPWARYSAAPRDGVGLMPLLQNPTMMVHPPALYTGYVSLSVPFAFAMAALITGRVGDEWIRATRRWTLFSWFFLGCGLLLGGNWAYNELGWGGYWAWDPVENVALLPWLTATAFLHSILIQQRRGMLKIWNMSLVIVSFALTLFGTFMNRSGIESSVHAFETKGLASPFIILIGATLIACFALVYWRLPGLGATNRLDGLLSRESAFLLNNLLLVGIAFAVFWGTIFPLISRAVRGAAGVISVGAPFYNRVTGPLFLLLLLAMAAGPLLPWRRASGETLRRNLLRPALAAVAVGVVSTVLVGNVAAALSFAASSLALFTVGLEFYRGTRAKRRATGYSWVRSLAHLIDGNHGRFGGYLVHVGIALVAVGVTGSIVLKADRQDTLRMGQSLAVGSYQVTPLSLQFGTVPNVGPEWQATVRVAKDGQPVATMRPRYILFQQNTIQARATGNQAIPDVALHSTPLEDFYMTLAAAPSADGTRVNLHVLVNPLLWWVWAGGYVVILGGLVAFSPDARERRSLVSAPDPATSPAVVGR